MDNWRDRRRGTPPAPKGAAADFSSEDRGYMRRALTLARGGIGLSSPNPPVGCVIVRDGRVVGRGLHEYALRDHAEVRALLEAGEQSRGSTVYVTLEPCSHYGRTPPCADRLVEAGVQRVVAGAIDPNPPVSGKGIDLLRKAGIRVDVDLMRDETLALIEPFACKVTTGRPLVVAKAGMTLDGRVSAPVGRDTWITSPEGREFGQTLRLQLDAILVGVGTIIADDPRLTYRGMRRKGRLLTRVVLDTTLRTSPDAHILRTAEAPVLIFCGRGAPAARRRRLEAQGAETVTVRHCSSGLDLEAVIEELGRRDMLGVLVEGGSGVHWSFLSAGLVDKFYFIVAPLVLGGTRAIPAVGGRGYRTVREAMPFRIRRAFNAGPDLVIEAYPRGSRSIISPWLVPAVPPSGARGPARPSGRK